MFSSIILASVNNFTQGTDDKNGKAPVILNVVAGKCPNRNVISGTVAENIGIAVGKTYLLQVREVEEDPTYGRQFIYSKLSEVDNPLTIIESVSKMDKAEVFAVEGPTAASSAKKLIEQHAGTGFEKSK